MSIWKNQIFVECCRLLVYILLVYMVMIFGEEEKLVKPRRATRQEESNLVVVKPHPTLLLWFVMRSSIRLHMFRIEAFDTFAELFHGDTTLS